MEPTENKMKRIPDVINNSATKNFTQVPNVLLRSAEISGKAKALLCLLLSNKEGWYSYMTTLKKMMKEGRDAIYSGLQELEKFGYLKRVPYRDKKTDEFRGSFWAYTDFPNEFNMEDTIQFLDNQGYYISDKDWEKSENTESGNSEMGNSESGNPQLKRPISNNKKKEQTTTTSSGSRKKVYKHPTKPKQEQNISASKEKNEVPISNKENGFITPALFDEFWQLYPRKVDKGKAKTIWNRLCNRKKDRPEWDTIRAALIEQKKSERWQETKFIPHPSTWLNQSRWEDDPTQMKLYKVENPRQNQNQPSNLYKEEGRQYSW